MSDWRLTPQNSALVVIDVQEKLMNVMPRRVELVGAIQRLIGAARILQIPTIVTAQYIKGVGPVCAEIMEATQAGRESPLGTTSLSRGRLCHRLKS